MKNLTISLAQFSVIQSKPEENLATAEMFIAQAADRGSDMICLPEMWTTGFNWTDNEKQAPDQIQTIKQVAGLARKYRIWLNGSMLAQNNEGQPANTSILFDSRGHQVAAYRKTHLFSLLHEDQHVAQGEKLTAADTPWGKVGLSVCYDIRFPELFRTYALQGVQFVLSPMAFPNPRMEHWKVLVRARAIENQMFMIGVNQVGSEDFGPEGTVTYFGHSCIIDPWGKTVIEANETDETLITATINMDDADEVRKKMSVLQDRRPDLYELS